MTDKFDFLHQVQSSTDHLRRHCFGNEFTVGMLVLLGDLVREGVLRVRHARAEMYGRMLACGLVPTYAVRRCDVCTFGRAERDHSPPVVFVSVAECESALCWGPPGAPRPGRQGDVKKCATVAQSGGAP